MYSLCEYFHVAGQTSAVSRTRVYANDTDDAHDDDAGDDDVMMMLMMTMIMTMIIFIECTCLLR